MKKTVSLRLNKDFRRLYGRGQSIVSPLLVVYFMKNKKGTNRLGITVNKKNGGAVLRNRIRRILKEAFRQIELNVKSGYDFVLVARGKTAFCKSTDIEKVLLKLLNEKGLLLWSLFLFGLFPFIKDLFLHLSVLPVVFIPLVRNIPKRHLSNMAFLKAFIYQLDGSWNVILFIRVVLTR